MSNVTIGTCVRHAPPLLHQQFVGSGVIFDLDRLTMTCSIVLLDGRVIVDLPLATLFDGSWVISERTMTSRQIDHLLAHAGEWEDWHKDKVAACTDVSRDSSFVHGVLHQDVSQRVQASVLRPDGRHQGFIRDGSIRHLDLIAAVEAE